MPSPSKRLSKTDMKQFGTLVLVGALAGALETVGANVIPEMQGSGDPDTTAITLGLVLGADLLRRFLTDTRIVSKEVAEKLVIKEEIIKNNIGKPRDE